MKQPMKPLAIATAALFAVHTPAYALSIEDVVSLMESRGYTDIDVSRTASTITIEAEGEGISRELVYDAKTGSLLEDIRERESDRSNSSLGPGAAYDSSDDDRDEDTYDDRDEDEAEDDDEDEDDAYDDDEDDEDQDDDEDDGYDDD
ncbi:MAG: PepSY domain-containing protein [Pseudomonadota bacterium]